MAHAFMLKFSFDRKMQSARGKKSYAFDMTVSFGKNRSARVIMKDSFRQFIDIFTYMVYLKDLHIFTCKNCGEKYLAVADMDYCTAPECLEEREKAKRRTKESAK